MLVYCLGVLLVLASTLELGNGLRRNRVLDADRAAGRPVADVEARTVECALWIETVVEHGHHDLQVSLGLGVAAHHAERAVESAVLPSDQARDDRVIGPLAGSHDVRVLGEAHQHKGCQCSGIGSPLISSTASRAKQHHLFRGVCTAQLEVVILM